MNELQKQLEELVNEFGIEAVMNNIKSNHSSKVFIPTNGWRQSFHHKSHTHAHALHPEKLMHEITATMKLHQYNIQMPNGTSHSWEASHGLSKHTGMQSF